ncbi:hypothetical protein [Streptomyces sp. NPDC018031]|uniref:hypothetical protein n=1 Tax=Streptomyces sp. NPDC018031 TaxID=3365033 RepID=UPI00379A04BA
MYRSREWVLDRIRQDHRSNPHLAVQVLASRHRVSRSTVAEALSLTLPAPEPRRRQSVLTPVRAAIDRMLLEDLRGPAAQRHTVRRILERLATEHGFTLASYSTVRDHVRIRRAELAEREAGRAPDTASGPPADQPHPS